jgi:threonyl-tRNA synthetase
MSEHLKNDLASMRHTAAHVLAAASSKLNAGTKLGVGPAIEDGFYHDIDVDPRWSDQDLKKLQKEMEKIQKMDLPITQKEVSKDEARQLFAHDPYKLELIDDIPSDTVGVSDMGDGFFVTLCKGGHVESTGQIGHFKLTRLSGVYWKGDANKPQLQRIYGVLFPTKDELADYLHMLEEAKKRDHKILGPQLGLFMFHETSPGMPYWLPNGMVVLNELLNFWREEHGSRGYQEISSPLINKKELWETSGHWEFYKEDMFVANVGENEVYGVKPMNCPNAMVVFGSEPRSYRDLPLRLSDTDVLHRYELSGTLNGLLRVRSFRQDDSHNFVTEEQIGEEYDRILDIAEKFYGIFGLGYRLRLGTRPEKFMGTVEAWDKAEAALKEVLNAKMGEGNYEIAEGDGAFYGPKIDIVMKDALKREWQMGTIQLDFQQPARFQLGYTDKDGSKKTPVVIHRVIYGSLDRFIGLLIEHYAGALPLWLSPVQAAILPISDDQLDYAHTIAADLRSAGIRVKVDDRGESIGKKIREAQLKKAPFMLIVGKKEVEENTVAVRSRDKGDEGAKSVEAIKAALLLAIKDKK